MRAAGILVCLVVAGCSFSPRVERMRPDTGPRGVASASPRVAVGRVTGGRESSFFTGPHLDAPTLAAALEDALRGADLWRSDARLRLDAEILGERPSGGSIASPDMGVELTVRYTLQEGAAGAPVWQETVGSGGWVRQSEVFVGVERMRRAIEAAARQNLDAVLARLRPVLARQSAG